MININPIRNVQEISPIENVNEGNLDGRKVTEVVDLEKGIIQEGDNPVVNNAEIFSNQSGYLSKLKKVASFAAITCLVGTSVTALNLPWLAASIIVWVNGKNNGDEDLEKKGRIATLYINVPFIVICTCIYSIKIYRNSYKN